MQISLDERAIREVHSTWIDAVNAGDLDRLLTLMADDVVSLNPGQVPLGRDRFSAVGACRSAVAVHAASRRWLSFFR